MQREDISLAPLFELVDRVEDNLGQSSYAVKNEVLVRHWTDKYAPEGLAVTQVVVPTSLRNKLLMVAHDIPAAGHMGIQKTLDRLRRHFYWPGISASVKTYVRSCLVCQRVGKGFVQVRAPLINLPVIQNPFSRLAIDIVGPLSTCEKSGNRFILTVMDLATRYSLAFPLRQHTAVEVAKALI